MDHHRAVGKIFDLVLLQRPDEVEPCPGDAHCLQRLGVLDQLLHPVFPQVTDAQAHQLGDVPGIGIFDRRNQRGSAEPSGAHLRFPDLRPYRIQIFRHV